MVLSMTDVIRKAMALRRLPSPSMARAIREAAGVSQADVAGSFDPPISRAAVSRWESGERRPRGSHLEQYVEILEALNGASA